MFKLLIFGTLAFVVGGFSGYGGSYVYDTKINQTEILKQELNEHDEVLGESSQSDEFKKNSIKTPFLTSTNSPTVSPEQIVLEELTPSITSTPSPTETPTEKTLNVASSEEINGFIERFASQYGIDPHFLRHIAVCESGFNPLAQNGSNLGLFQFTANTWISNRSEMGEETNPKLRLNAEEAVQTAAYMLSVGKRSAWPVC